MATTCDPRVYELAEVFLSDEEFNELPSKHRERVMNLACAIQQAAEDWIESDRLDRDPKPQPR